MTNTATRALTLAAMVGALIAAAITLALLTTVEEDGSGQLAGIIYCLPGHACEDDTTTDEPVVPVAHVAPVLTVDAEAAPVELVDALLEAGFVGTPSDNREALYVPVGTPVFVPGGMYLATADGWMQCLDGITTAEACGPTTGVVPVAIPS